MSNSLRRNLTKLRLSGQSILTGPPALAFLPALCLAAFWFGGEIALIAIAAIVPLVFAYVGAFGMNGDFPDRTKDLQSGVLDRAGFDTNSKNIWNATISGPLKSALFVVEIDAFSDLVARYGQDTADILIQQVGRRLTETLRDEDCIGRLGDARFAAALAPVGTLDLESCIQLAGRLQTTLEDPMVLNGTPIHVTCTIGFCESDQSPDVSHSAWLEAAATAQRAALRQGPSTLRAYSEQMRIETQTRASLRDEIALALDSGQIQPWFQPQISTDTGEIIGFEALARWQHPSRGMISPGDFLPVIEEDGLLERLAEVMMYHAFAALKAWDGSGHHIPMVGVNFTGMELGNPRLVDKIKWELDRFDLAPERLAIEVLETVLANAPDDMITKNINALADLGCQIDLDDFGTGHASIGSIRNFAVSRIKIDRSFVTKADQDTEQQRMISAILTMAERLRVETLAEGVETSGEHTLLSQLGCTYVQGFGIARPMTFDQTLDWIARHNAKLDNVPKISMQRRS